MGRNGLGNIAIDDISIAPGVCPTAPQVKYSCLMVQIILFPVVVRLLQRVLETAASRMMSAAGRTLRPGNH